MNDTAFDTDVQADLAGQVIEKLWSDDKPRQNQQIFAILDGARDEQIYPLVSNSQRPYACLYLEPLTDKLRAAAPYLIELDKTYTRMLIEKSWGASWGIYLRCDTPVSINALRHQYRKLNRVTGPEGKRLFFRYYDPRVLRTYLPTCYLAELDYFFGPVTDIFMEGDSAQSLLQFHHSEHGSVRKKFQLN